MSTLVDTTVSADTESSLLTALPLELRSIIHGFAGMIQSVLRAPPSEEEIQWLLETQQQITIFYSYDNECEVQPWKILPNQHRNRLQQFAICDAVYLDNHHKFVSLRTKSGRSIEWLTNWIMHGESVFLASRPDTPFAIPIPDLHSYFLIVEKRSKEWGIPSQARESTLALLAGVVTQLRACPIALETYLRVSADNFTIDTVMEMPPSYDRGMISTPDAEITEKCERYRKVLAGAIERK